MICVRGQNVGRLGFLLEMKFDTANIKLTQYQFNALIDGRMVGTVASYKFHDNGPQCFGRQLQRWDAHDISLQRNAKVIIAGR